MKKKYIYIIICIFFVLGVVLCYFSFRNNRSDVANSETVSVQNKIIEEAFSDDTKIMQEMREEVEISVDEVWENTVKITVESPNICEELIAFVASLEGNITDEQMEEKILSLIHNTQKNINTYELHFDDEEELDIQYTEEYMNAVSCGLNEFYNYAMNQVILEILEEAEDE